MTREDAIHFANCLKNNYTVDLNDMEAFCDMAIKALEQEPVLDKIRGEIEQITDTMGVSYNQYVSKIDVLQIIDKYKAESEGI
jgi:hypothetical protein